MDSPDGAGGTGGRDATAQRDSATADASTDVSRDVANTARDASDAGVTAPEAAVVIVDARAPDAAAVDSGAPSLEASIAEASLDSGGLPGAGGPAAVAQQFRAPAGPNVANGQAVFRFETFGNEGFWTHVLQLPQGLHDDQITPAQAIAAGLSIDSDAIPAALKARFALDLADAGATPDLTTLPSFNDAANLEALVEANAVIGMAAKGVTTLNGTLDINPADVFAGESVGVSCAFCHSITDGSVLKTATGGSIGKRVDGLTNHNLNVGASIALANRSRAYYPTLALDLVANMHGSVSRLGPKSATNPLIGPTPSEAEVDAYLNNPQLYPVGMFDDAPDGNGAPMHITPMFRADLAAPWGSEASIHMLHNFSNLVYTALLDPTDLIGATPTPVAVALVDGGPPLTGAELFEYERGGPAGLELIANYRNIIEDDLGILPYSATNPNGYPYVGRTNRGPDVLTGLAAGAKVEPSPLGIQVNQTKLLDMNAYFYSLRAPAGVAGNAATVAAGRAIFRQQCTSCHNDDQSKFVPENVVPFNNKVDLYANAPTRPDLFPSWDGPVLAQRPAAPFAALAPVRDFAGIFDDKLIVIEASNQMQPRGDALPLLLDLARKPSFLHDDSVRAATPEASLNLLLNPSRGAAVPHPFFVADATARAAVVMFLRSLDDNPLP